MNKLDILPSMILEKYKHTLIVDLEATCCDQKTIPRTERETIEIGAVMIETLNLTVIDEFTIFIKPIRYPQLTTFCTELTSITQADVDAAPIYPEAITLFKQWLNQYPDFVFCSWGDYDKNQLIQDSQFHRIPYPMDTEHVNIKVLFSKTQSLKRRFGMGAALKQAGLALDGTHHRGIDDARNMARLMPYITGRERV